MREEEFSATAKVQVLLEIKLSQPWGDERVGTITKAARAQAAAKIEKLIATDKDVRHVKSGKVSIALQSTN